MTIKVSARQAVSGLQIALLVLIVGLLLWSKPWSQNTSTEMRKISVSGEAILDATPDEFVFNPYYQRTGSDKEALQTELTQKANSVIDELKKMGVSEENIKLDASSYDNWYWEADEEGVLNVSLRIQVMGDELVQSVQNYLLTTGAEGQLTPRAVFSESKKNELNTQATTQASEDARSKAEAQAKLFGAKLGKVISIEEQASQDFEVYPLERYALDSSMQSEPEALPVLPGQNEFKKTINVTYELQ